MEEITEDDPRREDAVAALDAMADGRATLDGAGRIDEIDGRAATLLGRSREALVGTSIETIDPDASVDLVAGQDGDDGSTIGPIEIDTDGPERRCRIYAVSGGEPTRLYFEEVGRRDAYERAVTALNEANRQLFGADTPGEICAIAVHTASELLGHRICGIWLLDEERNRLDPIAGSDGAYEALGGLPQFRESEGLVWDAFRDGEPVLYDDVGAHRDVFNPETPIRSELIVPIGTQGVLMAGELETGAFEPLDLDLAELLATSTDIALEQANRERLLRRRTRDLERQSAFFETARSAIEDLIGPQLERASGKSKGVARKEVEAARERLDDVRILTTTEATVERTQRPLGPLFERAADRIPGRVEYDQPGVSARVAPDHVVTVFETLFRELGPEAGRIRISAAFEGEGRLVFESTSDAIDIEDPVVTDTERALRLAVSRRIVENHGWQLKIDDRRDPPRFVVDEVASLAPLE